MAEVDDRGRAAGQELGQAVARRHETRLFVVQEALAEAVAAAVEQARVAEFLDEAAEDRRLRGVAMHVDEARHDQPAAARQLLVDRPVVAAAHLEQPTPGPGDVAIPQVDVAVRRSFPTDDPFCVADAADMRLQDRLLGSHVTISGNAVMRATSTKMQTRKGSTPRTTSVTVPRPRTACTT